jgi:protein-S-isoprenylcysteine O-methyltransferase Ste14
LFHIAPIATEAHAAGVATIKRLFMTWTNSLSALVWIAFIGVLLFGSAGTLDWTAGWIFMAEFVICAAVITAWLAFHDQGLLKERMGGLYQKGQGIADRIFMSFIAVVWYGWLALMGVDAKRWGHSHMPEPLVITGAVLIPLGFIIVWRVFRENSFAAPVIRIQEDRGQHVIDTGPYALVRHPMYSGAILYLLGMPLLLGSWLGLLALPLIVAALTIRIFIEEAALKKGIAGYNAYMARVRYRLVPGVW